MRITSRSSRRLSLGVRPHWAHRHEIFSGFAALFCIIGFVTDTPRVEETVRLNHKLQRTRHPGAWYASVPTRS